MIPTEGFNPARIEEYSRGIEFTLGTSILKAAVLDRDYRTEAEVQELKTALTRAMCFAHIHDRKEIENYLLELSPLERAIRTRLFEQSARTGKDLELAEDVADSLLQITDSIKQEVLGLYISRYVYGQKTVAPRIDDSTLTTQAIKKFDEAWRDLPSRLALVPGKRVLALLNARLQEMYGISLSPSFIVGRFKGEEVPETIRSLVNELDNFRRRTP